ncbi:HET-domain-containing protein [Neofusicoccum parvum]|uniref:HET-domain-containing protein n=1 Tax=Neofusicoccum parvum TaxID=310453 RepID=A0ACB5RY53_9PEZI|nr:HET-domain-containing protein [Neofusicoccum parvum]
MESCSGSYPYLPLNKVGFRYIILQPGAFDTDIKCSLVQDVDGTDKTPYEALSYVWGKSTDTIPIDIDGNVVIWLGREDEPVKVYKKYDRPIEDAFQLAKDIAAIPSQNDLEDLLSSVASKDAFMVLSRLFDRTWFERVWVLQELVAAARADVVCGKSSIPWSTFEDAYAQLDEFFSEEIYGDWVFLDSAFRDWWRPVFNRFSVLRQQLTGRWTHPGLEHAILFILGTFITELSATDDRDRLWGVISLIAHDGPIDAALAPDYRKPAPRVFADLARRLIAGTGSLATLHACDHIAADNQPSWAPSWTRINRPIHLLHATTPLRPPPGPPPSISLASDDVLRARGVRLGAVRAVTPACRVENRGTASWTTAFAPLFSAWEAELWRVVEGDGGGGGDEKAFRDACREAFLFGFEMGTRTREEDGETYDMLLGRAGRPAREIVVEDVSVLDMFAARAVRNVHEQCAFVTDGGCVGRTYDDANDAWVGDWVCCLQGAYAPLLLRPAEEEGKFWFVGTCVLSGFMDMDVQADILGREEELRDNLLLPFLTTGSINPDFLVSTQQCH